MKDLLKLITVVLIAILLTALGHFILYSVDRAKNVNAVQSEVKNRQYTSFNPNSSVNIMTWDIDNAAYVEDETYKHKLVTTKTVYDNLSVIYETIKKNNDDIVLLQNVDKSAEKSVGVNEMRYISRRLEDSSMAYTYDTLNTLYTLDLPFASRYSGLLSFSKAKASFVEALPITRAEKLEDKVFNGKCVVQVSKYPIEGTNVLLSVFNINLSKDASVNNDQISDILNHIDKEYTEYGNIVIVGGNWNAVMDSRSSLSSVWHPNNMDKKLSAFILNGWRFVTDELNPNAVVYDSRRSENVYYPLDGFLVSPEVSVRRSRAIDVNPRASSHNPVMMEFVLDLSKKRN